MAAALTSQAMPGHETALYAALGPAYRLAFAMLGSRAMAEDAVQEAALRAWRKLDQLRDGMPLGPWFLGIVANECRSVRRGRWSRVLLMSRVGVEPTLLPDLEGDLDLRRAIAAMKRDDRLILVLRYYLDLSVEDTAATLRVSVDAVKSRTYRAINRLRDAVVLTEGGKP